MESYIKENLIGSGVTVKQGGKYYTKIHNKHIERYGINGAENIRDNIISTYSAAIRQKENDHLNNNILLVGKVQSGKTSNLELFTALAFDNGFNMVIIYGGYDKTLLEQTTERFKKSFDIDDDMDKDNPVIFSSGDNYKLDTLDNVIISDILSANKPILIISMKRPKALKNVNALLGRIDTLQLKPFIIDDEGDQASLNTKKEKAKDASATYAAIVKMKDLLSNPLYLSVTATPHALIFLDQYSKLRPDGIRLIEPGIGYCGAESYHLCNSDVIEIIPNEEQIDLNDGKLVKSLKHAIIHFIISSAILSKRGIIYADMIIHSHRNTDDHGSVYRLVRAFIERLKVEKNSGDQYSLDIEKPEFEEVYKKLFSDVIRRNYNFNELWAVICDDVLERVYIILKNSKGEITQANEKYQRYKIYIGGDLLQRGVTFPYLVTTYFSRWAKDGGNMDTNLQRARWFGYREKWIDLCKIFTSESISREFTNLSEIEIDLWEQFFSVQNGAAKIEEILIRADNTTQKPTRKTVASYSTIAFKNKWIKQRVGIFDLNQIRINNSLVDEFISSGDFHDMNQGRRDGKSTAKYAAYERDAISKLIDHMQAIFDLEPFERRPLRDLIESSGKIYIILMNDLDGAGRKRSFYSDNKIYALQQGADNTDLEKANYLGDRYVIYDPDSINVQIHKITPKKKNAQGVVEVLADYSQYMFAIYIPKEKKYFVRG